MWALGESEISVYPVNVLVAGPGMCHGKEARECDVVVHLHELDHGAVSGR